MVRDSLRDQESMVTVSLETSECGQGVSEDQDCIAPGVYRIRRLQSGGFTLARGEGLCIMRSWYLKSLYLELSSFDIRFCSMSTALEKGDLLLSRHSERVNLTLLGRGALDPLFRVQEWSF